LSILVFFMALVMASGCSTAKKSSGDENVMQQEAKASEREQKKQEEDISLALYFVKFTADDAYMVREIQTIPHTKQVAKAALQELINDEKSIFPPGTEVLGINIEKGLATVNFNEAVLNNTNVGSSGEALGIQSIVNTLTEFPSIERVAFQVEGKVDGRARDWWGHIGLYEQPFTRNLSKVYEPAIWVTHPSPNQIASVPLLVKGSARVFEGTVNIRLLDGQGNVLAESHTTASAAAPERGDFETSLKYEPPPAGEGTLEVYWTSPIDGSVQDKVSIPLQWP